MKQRRKLPLEQAKQCYVHRYTMEHVPNWARKPCSGNGKYYAPQFKSDQEWYDNTHFPPHPDLPKHETHCYTSNQTWPKGHWLENPFQKN